MPPACAAPEIRPLAPDHSGGSASDVRLVHLQVVGREQMAVAADTGYGDGLQGTLQGKAQISFGCPKARPRYQFLSSRLRCSQAGRIHSVSPKEPPYRIPGRPVRFL